MDDDIDYIPNVIRTDPEVALRALTLFPVVELAFGAPRINILDWLEEADLARELTPFERAFVETETPSKRQVINAGWWSERLIVLCWALSLVDKLPPPDQECATGPLQDLLPPFADISPAHFITTARLRPDEELLAMAETILGQHWEARDAKRTGAAPRFPVTIGIVQERHCAINWIVGYEGASWDMVAADT